MSPVIIMLYVEPDFYPEFQCIASACRHSCCLGWEIDVDQDTARLYNELPGPLGEELREKLCLLPEPHFKMTAQGRCPFLNNKGLCRLILAYGEDVLCDICREHPRFYNDFPQRQETGLGLCCEEAARLLLAGEKPLKLIYTVEGEPEEEEPELIVLRRKLLDILAGTELPMEKRLESCCALMDMPKLEFDMVYWREFYLGLERLDEVWTSALKGLSPVKGELPGGMAHTRLLQYFIYRHFASAENRREAALLLQFCILSLRLISALERSGAELSELVRLYSSEIEYSDENIGRITEAISPLLFGSQHI